MVPVPVYRAVIEAFRPAPDGGWDSCHGGPMVSYHFRPIPTSPGTDLGEAGLRVVSTGGDRPCCTVLAPPGSELVPVGETLRLRVPDVAKSLDAFTARLLGTHRRDGFDLVRRIEVTFGPAPTTPPLPTTQLSMAFDD